MNFNRIYEQRINNDSKIYEVTNHVTIRDITPRKSNRVARTFEEMLKYEMDNLDSIEDRITPYLEMFKNDNDLQGILRQIYSDR